MNACYESAVRLRTFTAALTSICEGRVKVVCDGRACTNGSTIHLPLPQQIISAAYQEALCGIGCHEAAHIYYGSPPRFRSFVAEWDPSTAQLAADCYNAVLDVADETRFERRFTLANRYFEASTSQAALDWVKPPLMLPTTAQGILVAALLKVRRRRIRDRFASRVVQAVFSHDSTVWQCVTILRKAVTRSGKGLPNRTQREWRRLEDLARQLFAAFPSYVRQSPPRLKAVQITCQLEADGGGGSFGESFGAVIAAATDGRFEFRGQSAELDELSRATSGAVGRATGSLALQGETQLRTCFTRYAKLLLNARKPVLVRASRIGPRIGDVTRVRTDGRALLSRAIQPEAHCAVAICLDCSSSMHHCLKEVAGVAAAMCQALHDAGGNVACWQFGDEARRVARRKMRFVHDMGGTRTDAVISDAREWLAAQAESRKVLAIFTDGEPHQPELCAKEVAACRRHRVCVLAGTFPGVDCDRLRASMPGAEAFEIGKNLPQSFHQAIRRIIRGAVY